jgi:hypothetical protein
MASETVTDRVGVQRGDHVCGFYYGDEERDAILLPFLRDGLTNGDKCVAVVDSTGPAELRGRLGVVDDHVTSGQVEFYGSAETYLRGGSFEPESMISFWEERARATEEEGRFTFARVVGEMAWLERVPPQREHVVRYESWADGFAARYPHAVLCLYDLRRLGLLRTHPKLLLGGLVLENPHHITGDEFAAARR